MDIDKLKIKFSKLLLKEKEESGLTYQAIGDVQGIRRQSVRGVLTLDDEPTIERLLGISEAMGFDIKIQLNKGKEKEIVLYETKRSKGKLRK